jgi:S-adenosylmethionine decarboxylase
MVSLENPERFTFSPSKGTPNLTINHEATVDLDSTNAFEGPEKLLEVWFAPGPDALPAGAAKDGLKAVSAETWKEMLDIVNCKVLSVVESEHLDAYLLSESSMFVFAHKLILKTCGTTTLLWGLPRMLEIAATKAGFPHHVVSGVKGMSTAATPYRVFYSRKNFLFPDKQRGPHRSWRDEVKYLDNMFNGGSAYMVGKMNGDHWYLYLTSPNTILTPPRTPDQEEKGTETKILQFPVDVGKALHSGSLGNDDETLEVLMTDLDPENAKQFYLENATAVAEGKYLQRAREARVEAAHHLGDLNGHVHNLSLSGTTAGHSSAAVSNGSASDETFDVFSNTSSDHNDDLLTAATSQEDLKYPEEISTEGHVLGTVVSESCGLSDVYPTSRYPDARVDAYLFTPCGFSANGVIPAPPDAVGQGREDTHYFTVHVTPEPHCSYASFETNVPGRQTGRETSEVIQHVVDIFKPGRFSVTLFEARVSNVEAEELEDMVEVKVKRAPGRAKKMESISGYRRVERIVHEFDGYDLVFRFYEKEGWKGGNGVRVGEEC